MFGFLKKIFKNVNQMNSFVDDYKKSARDIALPAIAYVKWGKELVEKGDIEGAIEKFKQSIKICPNTPTAYINLGNLAMKSVDYDEAIEYFLNAVRLDKNSPVKWCLLADAYGKNGNKKECIKAYKHALAVDTRRHDTYVEYARFLVIFNMVDEALKILNEAYLINPQDTESLYNAGRLYLSKKDYENALKCFNLIVAIQPYNHMALFEMAKCHFMLKNYQFVVNFGLRALSFDPRNIENYIILAKTLCALGQEEKCREILDNAKLEGLCSVELMCTYGDCLQNFGDWKTSVEKYKAAIIVDKASYSAHFGLASSYIKLKENELARKELNKALQIRPNEARAIFNLALLDFDEGEYEKALCAFKDVLSKDKTIPNIYYNIACAYKMLGELQNAVKFWEKHLEYSPNNLSSLINLANTYAQLDENTLAIRRARKAYTLNKDNVDAVMTYGVMLLKDGEIFDAKEMFEKALSLKPDFINAKFAIIECTIKTNKPKEALAELENYEKDFGGEKSYLMLKLLAYAKLLEGEENNYLREQILIICDKILTDYGADSWVENLREKYKNTNNE